jgi:predicted permease
MTRIWSPFIRRRKRDAELAEEMTSYLAEEMDENIARGMQPEVARRKAYLKFGNPQLVRESLWRQNTVAFLDSVARDLRYSARTLARSPGFTVVAVLVMALGIGANVALLTVVRCVLLNPLPYRDSGQLYTLYQSEKASPNSRQFMPIDAGSAGVWKNTSPRLADLAMISPWQEYNVSADGGRLPEQIIASWCSANFFPLLGVNPALGRAFTEADDRPEAEATVVLSFPFWKRRFNGDPAVLGKKIWLDARSYTVIGVLPPSFSYSSSMSGNTTQVWTPLSHEAPPEMLHDFHDHEFLVIARLLPGATLGGLLSQLKAVQGEIKASHPEPPVHNAMNGRSMLDDSVENYKTSLWVLLAATGCVLLIACLNVASLLVARTAARKKELAIRSALGGGRWALLRERLTESVLLAASGGALGLLMAWAALAWLVKTRTDINRIESVHIDAVAIAFAVAAVVLCGLFSGLIAAMSTSRKQILTGLQDSSRGSSTGNARAGLRKGLLILEVGLTVVLLVGAGLLLKSYQHLRGTDLGIPADNVLTMSVNLPEVRYKNAAQRVSFFERLIAKVRAEPGVEAAGLVSTAPGQGWNGDHLMSVVEHPPLPTGIGLDMNVRGADPGYFAASQLPLLRGRIFTLDERLDRDHVVVISQSAAQLSFPGEDPVGKHLKVGVTGEVYEVLGVVGDVRWSITEPIHPTLYWPIYGNGYESATLLIRSTRRVESLSVPTQKILGDLDPDLPVFNVSTLRETIGKAALGSEFDSTLVLAFALIALLLAAAGLYGVLAYLVAQRTTEIGIRIALGAQRNQVLSLVLLNGLWPALIGLILGLAASAATARLIASMLFETEPLDPLVFLTVTIALLLVAGLACLLPAWRASRLNPMEALRMD